MKNLLSYDKYLENKNINYPSINFLDPCSLITWFNVNKLGFSIKKKDSIALDKGSIFLGFYVLIIGIIWIINFALKDGFFYALLDYGWP